MKTEITFGIDFIIRFNKTQKERALLYARITANGERKEMSLKQEVNTRDWDSAREIVKGKSEEARSINNYIEDVRYGLKEKYRMLIDKQQIVSADAIKKAYLGTHSVQKSEQTMSSLMKYHRKIASDTLEKGTLKNYGATEKYLMNFIKFSMKENDIYLSQVNYEFMTELEHFIRHNPIKAHDPCKGNGVQKHLERLKKMMSWAKKLGWVSTDPFANYTLTKTKYRRQKLDISELMKIEKTEFFHPSIAYVKDLFLFCCYTGLAYCDVIALKPSSFETDSHGNLWCKIYRQKSDELSTVPVMKCAADLVLKYKEHVKSVLKQTVFPYISNQELNRNLKTIGEICEIRKYMSFHLARHTFATAVTLKNGVPIETISKMLGHTKISTTQIYAEVDHEKIVADMAGVEEKLNDKKAKKI